MTTRSQRDPSVEAAVRRARQTKLSCLSCGARRYVADSEEGPLLRLPARLPRSPLDRPQSAPAVGQVATTTWSMLAPFERHDGDEATRVRLFNFMLVGHADPLMPLSPHLGPHVTPVAPFSSRPTEFLSLPWRDRVDGLRIEVTTERGGRPGAVSLKTYGDVLRHYRWHPERKSSDPAGGVGLRNSRGLLPRRRVVAIGIRHVGKEANRLDEVEAGTLDVSEDVHIQYPDERGEWQTVRPALRAIGVKELARRTGMSERTLRSRVNLARLPRDADRRAPNGDHSRGKWLACRGFDPGRPGSRPSGQAGRR
jgi:hypothetical protein